MKEADVVIARLAARRHGVVTRALLIAHGVHPRAITQRIRDGRLIVLHRGVYAVGHAQLRREGEWLAAVDAYGGRAALSHASALAAWGIRDSVAAFVDVTVATGAGVSRRRGIRVFRHADLRSEEVTRIHEIPVTTVPRTLLDAAAILDPAALRRATEAGFRKHGVTVEEMRRLLATHSGRRGSRRLRALIDDFDAYGVTFTRSGLEALILELCLSARLPRPEINHRSHREIDCCWPDHGLVVELDGYETHKGRAQFVADRARNRQHVLRGDTIVAYTHYDLTYSPQRVIAEIRTLLQRASS